MSGLMEAATAILGASERRVEVAAHNVSNVSTPGYKRRVGFQQVLDARQDGVAALPAPSTVAEVSDLKQGALTATGNPLDLAISGDGFFRLRDGDQPLYSRQGRFRLGEGGALVTAQGYVLQDAGGGDVVLDRAAVSVLGDGTVLDGGRPVARVAIAGVPKGAAIERVGETYFRIPDAALEEVPGALVRQGMVEGANVVLGDEMVAMMAATRQAEGGARLVQVYDELMGRVMSVLGKGGR